jgi:hypothetical protein
LNKENFLKKYIFFSIALIFACTPQQEKINTLTQNGAWCWFSDPRGVRHEDKTFIGWINTDGDVVVSSYNHKTSALDTTVIHEKLEVDDHDNPSILVRNDGRIMVFYSKHGTKKFPMILRVSENPGDISSFGPPQRLALNDTLTFPANFRNSYTYTNPYQLAGEDNKIYLFWRGMGHKPNVSYSDDGGQVWSPGKIMIKPEDVYPNRRPYLKVSSKGKDKIHFAFTDGHPNREPQNSIYYACYKSGSFYKANGEKITDFESLPFTPRQASVVYDATKTNHRAWIWDVAEDKNGHPVIVYTRLFEMRDHRYYYARWDGQQWFNVELCRAGKWFPQTQPESEETEKQYSGGIILDHSNPSTVYLSREINDVFEIEKWTSKDMGKTWETIAITEDSALDNVRPFVVRNSKEGQGPHVVWMKNHKYLHYTDYQSELLWH